MNYTNIFEEYLSNFIHYKGVSAKMYGKFQYAESMDSKFEIFHVNDK